MQSVMMPSKGWQSSEKNPLSLMGCKNYAVRIMPCLKRSIKKTFSLAVLFLFLKRGFLFSVCLVHSIQQSCAQGVALSPTRVPISEMKLFS